MRNLQAPNYVQEEVLAIAEKQFPMIREGKPKQSRKDASGQESSDLDAEHQDMVRQTPRPLPKQQSNPKAIAFSTVKN